MSVPRNDAPAHSRKLGDGEPLRRIQTYRIKPAAKNRIAASRNGGTSRTPTPIAREGDPPTKKMIADARRNFHEGGRAGFLFCSTKNNLILRVVFRNRLLRWKNSLGLTKI